MAKGGFLGFGLRHEYPLNPKASLGDLINCLKGNDAIIQRVCSQLSLQTMLRVVYADETEDEAPYFVMVKDIVDYSEDCDIDTGIGEVSTQYEGGKRVSITGSIADEARREGLEGYGSNHHAKDEYIDVDWVTDLTKFTVAKTSYITYGNEAHMDFVSLRPCKVAYGLISSHQSPDVWQCLPSCARWSGWRQGDACGRAGEEKAKVLLIVIYHSTCRVSESIFRGHLY